MEKQDVTEKLPIIAPSAFYIESSGTVFVNYSAFPADFAKDVMNKVDYEGADLFEGKKLQSWKQKLCSEFGSITIGKMFKEPTQLIKDFTEYTRSKISPHDFKYIASFWPPVLVNSKSNYIHFFIIQLIHNCKKPENVLAWLAVSVFPPSFTRSTKNEIQAICRAKVGKKNGCWATLDNESVFHLYSFQQNEQKEIATGKAEKILLAKDNITLQIDNGTKVFSSFTPEDPEQTELWMNVIKGPVPFPFFITSFSTPAIDELYSAGLSCIANADALVLRACLDSSILNPKEENSKKVLKTFMQIFCYSNKMTSFINSVVIGELSSFETNIDEFIKKESHIKNLWHLITQEYDSAGLKSHFQQLTRLIKSNGECGIGSASPDIKGIEKLVNSISLFITQSFSLIPPQYMHFLSIIRASLLLRTNNRASIYHFLSELFFIDYLLPILKQSLSSNICRLLYVIFSMGLMIDEFSSLMPIAKRLERHVYPRLMEFLFTISEMKEAPDYKIVSQAVLSRAIEEAMMVITSQPSMFKKSFTKLIDPNNEMNGPTLLGTNYASLLSTFFVHAFDTFEETTEVRKKEHKTRLARIDSLSDLIGSTVGTLFKRDPTEVIDPSKPRKFYKRVIKHSQP